MNVTDIASTRHTPPAAHEEPCQKSDGTMHTCALRCPEGTGTNCQRATYAHSPNDITRLSECHNLICVRQSRCDRHSHSYDPLTTKRLASLPQGKAWQTHPPTVGFGQSWEKTCPVSHREHRITAGTPILRDQQIERESHASARDQRPDAAGQRAVFSTLRLLAQDPAANLAACLTTKINAVRCPVITPPC